MSKVKSKIFQIEAKIASARKIIGKYFLINLQAPEIAKIATPGQFIEIRVSDDYEPLLRKPFSIHRVIGDEIEFLYEVVGRGTQLLSEKKAGDSLDIIAPLGNGFATVCVNSSVLVGGGMGAAPLLFLAEEIKIQYPATKILVLIGAKTKKQILCKNDFKKLGCDVRISTDDGSQGYKGKVTDLLKDLLRSKSQEPRAAIYACGPEPMLQDISRLSKTYHIPAQLSLEAYMACGFGACLGCAVNTVGGYKLACKDGPIFEADEIVW